MAICRLSGHKASAICDRVDTLYMPRSADKTEVCPTTGLSIFLRTAVSG